MIGDMQFFADIVAVKGNVQLSIFYPGGRDQLADLFHYLVRYKNAAGLNTYEHCIFQPDMIFQNLVT